MELNLLFFVNSILLGFGLAMDAFSVSVANGLKDSKITKPKASLIAGVFGFFQALMPLIGWICVHTIVVLLKAFDKAVPWIALVLLVFLGVKMISETVNEKKKEKEDTKEKEEIKEGEIKEKEGIKEGVIKEKEETKNTASITLKAILVQGIAVSIDALSVGFTFADFNVFEALISVSIIAVITFILSFTGIFIGKKIGNKFSNKAQIFGGVILIFIGLEIFITSMF